MKHLATLFALFAAVLIARGEPPTPPAATARSVTVDTNGLVRVPTNLWEANLGTISVKEARFGAKGDGVTDDTAAIQAAIAAWVAQIGTGLTNGAPVLYFPGGTYRITSTLTIDADSINARGPVIIGDNAKIVMDASNTPILALASDSMSFFRIAGLQLSYATAQDATKTSAIGIHFNGGAGESFANGTVENCVFANCYAAIAKTASSVVWNCRFSNLRIVDASKYALYFPNTGSGSPGNRFENILSLGNNLASGADALVYLQGQYGFTFDGLNADEVINRPLLYLASCYNGTLSGIRVENSGWSTDARYVVGLSGGEGNVFTGIEMQNCTNNAATVLYGVRNLVAGTVKVQSFTITSFDAKSKFKTYSAAGGYLIGAVPTLNTVSNFWGSQAVVESGSQPYISVINPRAGVVSADRGDADVTLASSDAEIQLFATALSADRTVTLPTAERWHGMRFTITKSSNTGAGKLAIGSIYTIQANKAESVTVVYDVSASWRLEKVSPLNTGAIQLAVTDFGAKGDGTTDDSTAAQAAIDKAAAAGGGTVYFPPGAYRMNVTLGNTSDNVRIVGERGNYLGSNTSIQPANTNNPCVTIGGDTAAQYTAGVILENLFFEGATSPVTRSATGIKCTGGAYEVTIRNVGFAHFAKGLDIEKGVNQSCNLIYLDKVMGRPDVTDAANRGIYIYGTDGTPIVNMTDCHIQTSGSLGYSMEVDGATVYLANTYFDLTDDHGILLSKSASSTPRLYCANAVFDAQAASDEVFTGFDDTTDFKGLVIGTYTCDGNFKYTGGAEVAMGGAAINGVASLNNPYAYGSLWFSEGTGTNAFDYTASGSRITVSSAGLMSILPTLGISTTKYMQFGATSDPTLSSGYAGLFAATDSDSVTRIAFKNSDGSTNAFQTVAASTLNVAGTIKVAGSASPSTTLPGEFAFDTNALAAARGTLQMYDGSSNVYVATFAATDVPAANDVLTYTGSGITEWKPGGSGSSPTTTRGDMIYRAASADDRIAIGMFMARLISDGTDPIWTSASGVDKVVIDEEWLTGSSAGSYVWSSAASGTGAAANGMSSETGAWGVNTITAGTTTNGYIWHRTRNDAVNFGQGEDRWEWRVKTPTSLADANENYVMFAGMSDAAGINLGTDTVGFVYNYQTNSAKWQAVCMTNAAAITVADTGLNVVQDTWYRLGVTVSADGTLATFYTNGVAACTINANIPLGTARATGPAVGIYNIWYTASTRSLRSDYFKYMHTHATPRW